MRTASGSSFHILQFSKYFQQFRFIQRPHAFLPGNVILLVGYVGYLTGSSLWSRWTFHHHFPDVNYTTSKLNELDVTQT